MSELDEITVQDLLDAAAMEHAMDRAQAAMIRSLIWDAQAASESSESS